MHDVPLLTTIAAGFAAAWVLGLLTHRIGLSPIVGYLLAGIVIGPYTPGFAGDIELAQQLAEIGVILLMFGVGLHFHPKDLMAVKSVAIPGAIGQSLAAAVLAMVAFHFFGWSYKSSFVLGMAMAVASTVVLLRVLMDRDMLNTSHGHVAVGWLIVEDIFTVLALVLVPLMATDSVTEAGASGVGGGSALTKIGWALGKLLVLVALVFLAGSRLIPWALTKVATLRSRELFTLTVLVFSIAIAVGSAVFFGASVALGAFLAGMVVAQSPVSHQAAADALPMRDAFAVLFFVSVGMLFDPSFVVREPWMTAAGLGIVLIVKPLAALIIVAALGKPLRTGLTVALGLAQIGEFSFILAQVAGEHKLLPDEGRHVLVAAAIFSITLNPILFRSLERIEAGFRRVPWLWHILNARAERAARGINASAASAANKTEKPLAVIVGYGPVGRLVDALLRDAGMETAVIEMNMHTVRMLNASGRIAVYGDGGHSEILESAGVRRAVHLVITLPHLSSRAALVLAARELNPAIEITVRARYLSEREALAAAGASKSVYEEGEAGVALARYVMERRGMDSAIIERLLGSVRALWKM